MAKKKTVKKKTAKKKKFRGHQARKDIDDIQAKICHALYIGAFIETACASAGLAKDTFYLWLKEGARDKAAGRKTRLAEFSDAIQHSQSGGEIKLISDINNAGEKNWQAAAHILAMKNPKQWGKKQIIKVEDEDEKDSAFTTENLNEILTKKIAEHEEDRWED